MCPDYARDLHSSFHCSPDHGNLCFRNGAIWKSGRVNASKQIVPRRVANFVEPLCVIAENLLSHLETLQDEAGNVKDITPEMYKWAFQGRITCPYGRMLLHRCQLQGHSRLEGSCPLSCSMETSTEHLSRRLPN